jgi:hypothetical protein
MRKNGAATLSLLIMKCRFLVFALLLTAPVFIAAQASFEVRGGLSVHTIENNALYHQLESMSNSETKTILGLNLVIAVEVPVAKRIAIQLEGQLLQKGGRTEEFFLLPNTGTTPVTKRFETTYRVDNLELPLLAEYQLLDKKVEVFLKLGASYGYTLRQRFSGDEMFYRANGQIFYLDLENIDWDAMLPDGGDFNRHDLSGLAGLGVETDLGGRTYVLDLRYMHDFTDWRTEKSDLNEEPQMRHRGIVLTAGVKW